MTHTVKRTQPWKWRTTARWRKQLKERDFEMETWIKGTITLIWVLRPFLYFLDWPTSFSQCFFVLYKPLQEGWNTTPPTDSHPSVSKHLHLLCFSIDWFRSFLNLLPICMNEWVCFLSYRYVRWSNPHEVTWHTVIPHIADIHVPKKNKSLLKTTYDTWFLNQNTEGKTCFTQKHRNTFFLMIRHCPDTLLMSIWTNKVS